MRNKFGRPKKHTLNQEEIGNFLETIGFKPQKIAQPWRHLIAFGEYEGKSAVFKLASTKAISLRTKNEFYWNEAVHSIDPECRKNFTVPKNLSFGEYKDLFYFIAQKFTGKPFVENGVLNYSKMLSKIKQIALATREIETLPIKKDVNFYITQKKSEKISTGERLLVSATEWTSRSSLNLDEFVKIIERNKDNIRTCVGHGDFVPRQLYDENGKIGIIDGEHAGLKGPIYYDVAWFYIRLRTEYDATDLANQYLLEFKNLLPEAEKNTFWEEFLPVFAQRYIGSVWDRGKNLDLEKEKIFQKQILDNKLLPD
jgi:hypothetical protein